MLRLSNEFSLLYLVAITAAVEAPCANLLHLLDYTLGLVVMKKKKVEFSSHTSNLALMRQCVRGFLETYPLSEKERTLMVLGVDEACTNVIRHAYQLRDDKMITLSLEGLRHCIRMRLRDYGKQTTTRALRRRSRNLIKPGGLGLHLIRRAFDKVDYVLKARGTELILTKNLAIGRRSHRRGDGAVG